MTKTDRAGQERDGTRREQDRAGADRATARQQDAKRLRKLQRRIDRLESEVAWLSRVVREASEHSDALATGPCPNCSRGVLVQRNGELRCRTCEYRRYL